MSKKQSEKRRRDSPVLSIAAEAKNLRSNAGQRKMGASAMMYEELDYRLVATFLASGATARY